MFIFRLLNIMVGQKINYNDKAGAWIGKVRVQKAHVLQKFVRYFKGVTVNTEGHIQRSRSLHLRDKLERTIPYSKRKTHKEKEEKRESKELGW